MNGFKPVSIEDQDYLEQILQGYQSASSEYTFTYIYMWRHDYGFSFAVHNNYLVIVSESGYDIPFALCPIPLDSVYEQDSFSETVQWLLSMFKAEDMTLVFGRVHQPLLQWFQSVPDISFLIEPSDKTSDYVYTVENMINLAGKKLSSKRNYV